LHAARLLVQLLIFNLFNLKLYSAFFEKQFYPRRGYDYFSFRESERNNREEAFIIEPRRGYLNKFEAIHLLFK